MQEWGLRKYMLQKIPFSKDVNIPNIKIMAMKTLNDVIADVYRSTAHYPKGIGAWDENP